jgi:hypothetical protein
MQFFSYLILYSAPQSLPPLSPISITPSPPPTPWTKSVEMRPTNDICHKRVGMAGWGEGVGGVHAGILSKLAFFYSMTVR